MTSNIIKKFSKKLFEGNFIIENIKGDASKRKYYRASSGGESLIIMDSSREKRNFINFLKSSSARILLFKSFLIILGILILLLDKISENFRKFIKFLLSLELSIIIRLFPPDEAL